VPKNPVDFAGGSRTALEEARVAEKLATLDYIDGIITNMPVNAFLNKSLGEVTRIAIEGAELLADIPKKYKKPVVTMKFRDLSDNIIETILKSSGIPIYNTPEDCARAMHVLVKYAQILKQA
jgi:acyl-CoA synthetase (NDP forming)